MNTDEHELIIAYKAGDPIAGSALLKLHAGLIGLWTNRYRHDVFYEDLLQEAKMAFLEGVRKHDPERGSKLTTYANMWVFARVVEFAASSRTIKVPSQTSRLRAHVQQLAALATYTSSLHAVCDNGEDDGIELIDLLPDVDAVNAEAYLTSTQFVQRLLETELDKREWEIVVRCVLDDTSDADLGREWNLSRERIRQLRERALAKIRVTWLNLNANGFRKQKEPRPRGRVRCPECFTRLAFPFGVGCTGCPWMPTPVLQQ